MHPPGPVKGKAGKLSKATGPHEKLISDDADNLAKTDDGRNLKPLPPLPPGYGFDEHNRPVPIVDPSFTPEEKERLDIILPVIRWAIGSKARVSALEFLGRLDQRKTLREIACYHKISPSAAHRAVRELRAFLEALR